MLTQYHTCDDSGLKGLQIKAPGEKENGKAALLSFMGTKVFSARYFCKSRSDPLRIKGNTSLGNSKRTHVFAFSLGAMVVPEPSQ